MVVMGDDVSVELCGGTHCRATGQIGLVKVVSEGSVSAGLRRIEAIAGTRSLEHLQSLTSILDDAAKALRCTPSEIRERIAAQQARIKEQEAAIKDLQLKLVSGAASAKDEEQFESDGYTVVSGRSTSRMWASSGNGRQDKAAGGTGVVFLASPARTGQQLIMV